MVKIINGEIVADDDPRLQQRHQPNPPGPRPAAADTLGDARRPTASAPVGLGAPGGAGNAGGGGGIGFNLSAPPLRFVPPPPGVEPLLGLPDTEVFGVRLSPYAILCAVTLGMFYGWRGVVMVLVIYYVYLASQNNAARGPGQQAQPGVPGGTAAATQQQQQQSGDMPTDFLTRYMNGPQPRKRPAGATRPGPEPPTGESAARQEGADGPGGAAGGGWAAFQGRGNKLGGK